MDERLPPAWAVSRPKPLARSAYDLVGAPLRMILLPDALNEGLGLTSLRAERFAVVLPELRGRVLDVGAGDNALLRLYERRVGPTDSVGVDVVDWRGGCRIVDDVARLPFENASFTTVSFVACLNHIPERRAALEEAFRVVAPGGRIVITMIGRVLGEVGHRVWWYGEDRHRDVAEGETAGLDRAEVIELVSQAGFRSITCRRFLYGLNTLYLAERPITV